jgi:hypothetical protein
LFREVVMRQQLAQQHEVPVQQELMQLAQQP